MYIFIDTNVLQHSARSENPDARDLKILNKILRRKEKGKRRPFTLIVSDQLTDEYYRNETNYPISARKKIGASGTIESDLLKKSQRDLSPEQKVVVENLKRIEASFKGFREKDLERFDKKWNELKDVIDKLFGLARVKINCDDEIYRKAHMRTMRGMHPRPKSDGGVVSIGDAINWEILLQQPDDANYALITADGDFVDAETKRLHKTLQDEWKRFHRKAKILVFTFIGDFLEFVEEKKKPVEKKPEVPKPQQGSITVSTSQTLPGWTSVNPSSTNSQTYTWPSSLELTAGNLASMSSITGTASITGSGVTMGNLSTGDEVKHCPFCGADQSKLDSSFNTFTYGGGRQYTCLSCGGWFRA